MSTKVELGQAIAFLQAEHKDLDVTGTRLEIWWQAVKDFPDGVVLAAATQYIRTGKFEPKVSDIVALCAAQLDGQWLGPDEAWGLMPKSEAESAMLTNEIAQAIAVASPFLEGGDRVAARMAFKDCYTRLVEKAKLEGRKPRYFPSYGTDRHGVVAMLAKAVQIGQIDVNAAIEWKPEMATEIVKMAGVNNHPLLAAPSENGKAAVKALLADLRAIK